VYLLTSCDGAFAAAVTLPLSRPSPAAGLPLTQARPAIVKALDQAGRLVSSEPVRQAVGVHERCQTPAATPGSCCG
jgi:valyl-tRNA synthetase